MNRAMKHLIASALFLLLAMPTVALAQQAGRGNDRGSNHDNNRGRDNDRGRDNHRGRDNDRPRYNQPTRPPRPTAPVPEPSAALVFGAGLLAARYAGRRRS